MSKVALLGPLFNKLTEGTLFHEKVVYFGAVLLVILVIWIVVKSLEK